MALSTYELHYKRLITRVLTSGTLEKVRNNNQAMTLFGESIKFDTGLNQDGLLQFPMLTSKQMYFKNIKHELKWIISGDTNIGYLHCNNVSIWDKWADKNGDIGKTYGHQMRDFNGADQFRSIILELEKFPESRQLVISLWNPVDIADGNLKPCYHAFQFVYTNKRLNIIVSQRSADIFVGLPYDMAFFTLLLILVCKQFNLLPGTVKINIGNAHIYKEHIKACYTYIDRIGHDLPSLIVNNEAILFFNPNKISLANYISEPFIPAEIII